MKLIHCKECERFLCKLTNGELEIKCPKCKTVNIVKVTSYKQMLTTEPKQVNIKA
jgi:LSD1 subclass zinc finger protein